MNIRRNISLRAFNTFGIDVEAIKFISVRNDEDLMSLYDSGEFAPESPFLLGGGSNLLFTRDIHETVLYSQIKGIRIIESDSSSVLLEVGAGENWHDFVTICLKNKYYGLENLALIPGFVGSAPVQNIGAYGVEQSMFFHSLKGFDIKTGENVELTTSECKFDYRNSIFKNELKKKFFVTKVRYKLSKNDNPNLDYKDLSKETDKFGIEKPDAQYIYDTVCRIRTQKLPNPKLIGNTGSFFKNPVISQNEFDKLKSKSSGLTGYKSTDGKVKLSAAWLVEQSGWKGRRIGDAGVYDKHALILVNYGKASGREIFELSEEIRKSVLDKFEVNLEREVEVI